MDPKSRITAEEALNHPYFNRNSNSSDLEVKKVFEDKKFEDMASESRVANSNNILLNKVPVNNFVE